MAVLLVAPATLAAQTPVVDALADSDARALVRTVLTAAPSKGVPVEPLLAKLQEGIAKGASPMRIGQAVQALSGRLEQASRALAPVRSVDELTAGANALQTGVPTTALTALRRVWPDRTLTVPLGVVAELAANGVAPRAASDRVRALMAGGASSPQLVAFGATVRSDVASGVAAGTALELRTRGVFSLLASPLGTTAIPSIPGRPIRP